MIKEQLTKSDIIDMELYDFFDLLARANINDVLVIKRALLDGKEAMLTLAEGHKNKMFDFKDKEFDQKIFDEEFTYTIQCFAMAMYLDKKVELCQRREYDLTPECFKKDVDKK